MNSEKIRELMKLLENFEHGFGFPHAEDHEVEIDDRPGITVAHRGGGFEEPSIHTVPRANKPNVGNRMFPGRVTLGNLHNVLDDMEMKGDRFSGESIEYVERFIKRLRSFYDRDDEE